jgi:demethylmenaquinone methyltransferase/2-methoxy-6-polyprenyl-1,4-benzoquinol methylase
MTGHDRQAGPPAPSAPDGAPLARVLASASIEALLDDPARKQAFVTPMFDVIAPRYDVFTRRFSFGMDAVWKRALVDALAPLLPTTRRALDVACGTGDLAAAIGAGAPAARVVGVDASTAMIAAAAERHRGDGPRFVVGDLMALPCAVASVDLVTAGYAVRNAPTAVGALAELARVVRPGGWIALLDFYRPPAPLWRALFLGYLRVAGDLVGWWWHRRPVVYGYIARSIARFMTADECSAALDAAGFEVRQVRRFLWGGIALHLAQRRR